MEAHQLSTKAARVGFDWKRVEDIFREVAGEIDELRGAISLMLIAKHRGRSPRPCAKRLAIFCSSRRTLRGTCRSQPEAALKLTIKKFGAGSVTSKANCGEQNRKFDETGWMIGTCGRKRSYSAMSCAEGIRLVFHFHFPFFIGIWELIPSAALRVIS